MTGPSPTSVQATFAATLADEWSRCGVTDAVICPGSRSTPLAVALYRSPIRAHVVLDERTAGFVALGLAKATGRAVPVVTTSGTAAVELHPAVVEAFHSGVPIVAVTADRPPELHGVGAPQTCEQHALYGGAVRWEHDPGVARDEAWSTWRSLAARCVAEAVYGPSGPGPVHLNLPFAEPLVGEPGDLPPGREGRESWHRVGVARAMPPSEAVAELVALAGSRGVVVAGHEPGCDRESYARAVAGLAAALGWPLLADPLSGARRTGLSGAGAPDFASSGVIAATDALLRTPDFSQRAVPEMILRLGRPWASRVVNEWIAASGAYQIVVDRYGDWADPGRTAAVVLCCDPVAFAGEVVAAVQRPAGSSAEESQSPWCSLWRDAERAAQDAIAEVLVADRNFTEPWIAREVVSRLPQAGALVVASSMPVREVEWFTVPDPDYATVLANRGVNGIDGVVSTAVGVAISEEFEPVVALAGDLAFLHDGGALMALPPNRRLTVVVVDNGGGGIFSFLPQVGTLAAAEFDALFRTPQGTDPLALAAAHGAAVTEVTDREGLPVALEKEFDTGGSQGGAHVAGGGRGGGAHVIVCRVVPESTVEMHRRIEEAVAVAAGAVVR